MAQLFKDYSPLADWYQHQRDHVEIRPEPEVDYNQLPLFTEALVAPVPAPWEDDYFEINPEGNITKRLIEAHPGYLEENPYLQYCMRKAYIAGEMAQWWADHEDPSENSEQKSKSAGDP